MTSRICCKILALSQKSFPATLFKCCSSGVCLSSAGGNLSRERRKAMWQKEWGHWVCGRGTLRPKHCHSCLQNPGAEEILLALPKRRLIELNPQFMSLFKFRNLSVIVNCVSKSQNVTPKLKQFPILFVVNFLGFHRDQTRHFGDRGDQGSLSIFALL